MKACEYKTILIIQFKYKIKEYARDLTIEHINMVCK